MSVKRTEEKRVALVTGSTSGIGHAIATQLMHDGFAVAFHSKSSVAVGKTLAAEYSDATYFQADLSDQRQSRQLIAEVLAHYERLDVLVNNTGISATIDHVSLRDASPEIWRELYEVNVIAPWTLVTEAENALRQSASADCPSCILNISSHAGIRPKGASIPYAVSKSGLESYD